MNNLCSLINYVALPLTHEDLLGEDVEDIVAKYNRVHFAGAQQGCNSDLILDSYPIIRHPYTLSVLSQYIFTTILLT